MAAAKTKAEKARNAVKQDEAADKAKKAEAERRKNMAIPEFKDSDGELKKLKGNDFPTTREGRLAWCDYNIERWNLKKLAEDVKTDPKAKMKKRREKLMKMLADLDESLDEEGNEAAE